MDRFEKTDHYIFVYGTLRAKGFFPITDFLENRVLFIGKANIIAHMYLVDYYPGIIQNINTQSRVYGEVYKLLNVPEDINTIDEYEGVSSPPTKNDLFKRITVEATFPDGKTKSCMAYAYNRKINPSMREISSGDYIQELEKKQNS